MTSGLPDLGPRGEGWVAIQLMILAAVGLAGASGPAWDGGLRVATTIVGLALIAGGGALAVRGLVDLGPALTALPRPRAGTTLVETGAYRLVRHPIYSGLILGAFGWGLLTAAPLALGSAVALLGFFELKSRREEAWLSATVPGYGAYAARTSRLIPLIH